MRAVQTQLLLDALAETHQVGVSQEEFTERVLYNAQRLGVSPDEYFTRVQEGNQLASIFSEVRRSKALAGAVEQATVTDASGTVLDVAALFGIEEIPPEEIDAEEIDAEDIDVKVVDADVVDADVVDTEERGADQANDDATGVPDDRGAAQDRSPDGENSDATSAASKPPAPAEA